MNHKILHIIFLFFIHKNCFSQMEKFPNGVYLTLEQFKNQKPSFNTNLQIIKRTSSDIFMLGGNDYKIESNNDTINAKFTKKTIFAYVKNDSIFLNCFKYKLQFWYALCLTSGNFLVFKSCMTNNDASNLAVIGGGIASGVMANKRYLNVLSLRTGNVKNLSKEYLIERLKENPKLSEQYKNEKEQESELTLIKYLNLLNQETSPNFIPIMN